MQGEFSNKYVRTCSFDIHLIFIATAITPDPVQNLTAAVDTRNPSVTLNWDPPANITAAHAEDITKYDVRFWDNDSDFQGERVVNDSTTTTVITRESGLRLRSTFTFRVRACSGGDTSQEWGTVSRFIGMQMCKGSISFTSIYLEKMISL